MKPRIVASVLLAALLFFLIPTGAAEASDEICFLSINDTLLDLNSMPVFVNGTAYVPNWVFSNFRIYFSSFDGINVSLYTTERQLYFNINEGTAYDGNGESFPATAIYRNGQVYVSAVAVCSFFGLACSYIRGKGYGDILRIKDSSAVLSDKNFLSAATLQMKTRYNEYMNSIATPSPSPTVPLPPGPGTSPDVSRWDTAVYLGFFGLPNGDILSLLEGYRVSSCFFLTAEDVLEGPDTVRRLLGAGHRVGVLCGDDPASDYQETSALIFEAAQEKTLFVAALPENSEALRQWAGENSLACVDFDLISLPGAALSAGKITRHLESGAERAFLCFGAGESDTDTLRQVLKHLADYKYSLPPLEEGDAAQ